MAWGIDFTPAAETWLQELPRADRTRMVKQIDKLGARGPTLGRPAVDSVNGSRCRNLKELRVRGSPLRALFAFGPDRRAIVLVGGSKAGKEKHWYRDNIAVADRLFAEHLTTFERGSACRVTRAGNRSAARQM